MCLTPSPLLFIMSSWKEAILSYERIMFLFLFCILFGGDDDDDGDLTAVVPNVSSSVYLSPSNNENDSHFMHLCI